MKRSAREHAKMSMTALKSDIPQSSIPPHLNPGHSPRRLKPCPVSGRYLLGESRGKVALGA